MKKRIKTICAVVISVLCILLGAGFYKATDYTKYLTIDMLLFYMRTTNAQNTNFSTVGNIVGNCLNFAWPYALGALGAWMLGLLIRFLIVRRRPADRPKKRGFFPWLGRHGRGIAVLISVALMFYGLSTTPLAKSLPGYFERANQTTRVFDEEYVDPAAVNLQFPGARRNLIWIFAESMETTCEGGLSETFPGENIMPGLTRLAEDNISLTGWRTATGTDWTVAGLVSQTAGVPLLLDINGNPYGVNIDFLGGSTTMGDLLADAGYNQLFICGSQASFGYRGDYFTQHGSAVWDYDAAIADGSLPSGYYKFWGFEDQKLYTFAKEHLTSLAAQDAPFNLTMLTVDTHFYNGYVCENCESTYPTQYENVVHCADDQLSEFVAWVQAQDFYQDTTIVITGDHLYMDDQYYQNYGIAHDDRTIYACIINPIEGLVNEKIDRLFTSFDLFPTVMTALGAQWDGNRLGLGVDLFSGEQTVAARIGLNELNAELSKRSARYEQLLYGRGE